MDRFAAMLLLLGVLVVLVLVLLALFTQFPITCTCIFILVYCLYLFMAYEESSFHSAQEFENRFWTLFGVLLSTALVFVQDSPLAFGHKYPGLGILLVLISGYVMHLWDRHVHRVSISRSSFIWRSGTSVNSLKKLGYSVEDQVKRINECIADIDKLLIPSTINNIINIQFVLRKEREIISIFQDSDAKELNYHVGHVTMGRVFYKIKDHTTAPHQSQIIQLLACDRLADLSVVSRVIVLNSLQLLRLKAHARAEQWVKNIILNTTLDDLSKLKTFTDAKGDYWSMTKLIYDDIKTESVRHDILKHIGKQAAVLKKHLQMRTKRAKNLWEHLAWRKILSDVDDTLFCSGGAYPAGVDKRYAKKVVYPGVLAFYRELDLGAQGPEEWPENDVGNLVFLSARPHVYKDMSEKANFAKFEKLRARGTDGRRGLHTVPSLLPGDISSGTNYIVTNDFEPLALKKLDNFQRYASIYPEYKQVFICDNGQGDVRAGEMMFDACPEQLEAMYIHVVKEISQTYGYDYERWKNKGFSPCFFRTYPEAALHAATLTPPLIRPKGLLRVCQDAVKDFQAIPSKSWLSPTDMAERRQELNQAIWKANQFLESCRVEPCALIRATRMWEDGERVRTPYGIGKILDFDPEANLYELELDWRPLNVQVAEHLEGEKLKAAPPSTRSTGTTRSAMHLHTVVESDESKDTADCTSTETTVKQKDHATEGCLHEFSTSSDQSEIGQHTSQTTANPKTALDKVHHSDVQEHKADYTPFKVRARIHGVKISKYTPPILPKIDKTQGSIFTFWTPGRVMKKPYFQKGARCTTPYGLACVVEHRIEQKLVVVDMVGWKARAYIRENDIKLATRGLLGSLFEQFSGNEGSQRKPREFPYEKGTLIRTPLGEGAVCRPLQPSSTPRDSQRSAQNEIGTVGISLVGWTLADGSHPVLYCTAENARKWKEIEGNDVKGLFSAFENLVSSSTALLGPFLPQTQAKLKKKSVTKIEQFYIDHAAVSTMFGHGRVVGFRPEDGVYKVRLCSWSLRNGSHPIAYLLEHSIKPWVADGCQIGDRVYTKLGITGSLASVTSESGVHVVTVPSIGMVCYLQPESVVRSIKAAVGDAVTTVYGEGRVERYRTEDDTYVIKLDGWNARLFAKDDSFDISSDGLQDRGYSAIDWIFRLFFSTESSTSSRLIRSRSNSVTSARSAA